MRRSILLFVVTGIFISVFAGFNISWMDSYGGAADDNCYSVIETSDGYYLMTGGTYSYGAGNNDFWLIKTDTDGDTVWMETYGGSGKERSFSVVETSDGHYLIGGDTYSYGAGGYDYWLIKTDTAGNVLWNKTYGDANNQYCRGILETEDGYYMIGGHSFDGADYNSQMIRTDSAGDTVWTHAYGGDLDEFCNSIIETHDGYFLMAGNSMDVDDYKYYMVKLNASGDTLWTLTHGGDSTDYCYSVIEDDNGDYYMGGYTTSFGAGGNDCYIVKTNDNGDVLWEKTYGTTDDERIYAMGKTSDGNVMFVGACTQSSSDSLDIYIAKLNSDGDTLWTQTTGGSGMDYGRAITRTADGYYLICGYTTSFGSGAYDYILIKGDDGTAGIVNTLNNDTKCEYRVSDNGYLLLTLPEASIVHVMLYDVTGRTVSDQSISLGAGEHSIDVTAKQGIYFAKINTQFSDISAKIVNIK